MNMKRGFLRATVCGAALISAGALISISNSAYAACGTGGQCSVTGGYGAGATFSGGNYWATDFIFNGTRISTGSPALQATNPGSSIDASNITIEPISGSIWVWQWQQGYNQVKAQADNGGEVTLTDSTLTGGRNGILAQGNNSKITISGGSINVLDNAATVRGTSSLVFNGGVALTSTNTSSISVHAYGDSRVEFDDAIISATNWNGRAALGDDKADLSFINTTIQASGSLGKGIEAAGDANVLFTKGTIEASGINSYAVLGQGNAQSTFDETTITASGADSGGIHAEASAKITFNNGTIEASGTFGQGVRAQHDSEVNLNQTRITTSNSNGSGMLTDGNARINFKDGVIEASGSNSRAVRSDGQSRLSIENSNLNATGNNSNAFGFFGLAGTPATSGSIVEVLNSKVTASSQATAIRAWGETFIHQLNVTDSSIDGGNRLVEAQDTSRLVLNANRSALSGAARTTGNANFSMNLQDSLWTIRHDIAGNGNSSLSNLNLTNSVIRFDAPQGGVLGTYQTLRVGAGNPATLDVYNIDAYSHIEMNSFINAGGGYSNQYTDQLLIDGNVNGKTLLKINEMIGSTGAPTSLYGTNAAHEGLSTAQVSGLAQPDSFYIEGNYMTQKAKPYVYRLYAFGPGSAHGTADNAQKRVGGVSHWDYRLQNEFIRNSHGWAVQVVPQVASYLTAPTALFQAGLMDVGNLHSRVSELRQNSAAGESLDADEQISEQPTKARGNFFLRAYGGDYNYHSDLSSIRYGYDADIRYKAVQAGGSLYGFDTASGQMMFGLAGSYGDLSFSPHRYDSRKTPMNIWSASAYASWLGTNGFYVDTILAYGGFSGTVSTARHGRTAKLKGNSITASVEMGQNFALSDGWSIEPQAQITYQKLSFDRAHDIDDFAVVLGSPDQWVGRIGGKISKEMAVESVERLVLYGKLNLIHGFGDGDRVFLGDNFRIGEFGTHIEGGLGVNLDMTKNASLYGDVTYQGRVSDGGSNGLSLNGGLRFQF